MTIYQKAVKETADKLQIPFDIVDKVYKAYWLSIRQYIQELPLDSNIKEEDFNKLRTSINIPSLGKLHASYTKIHNIKNKINYIKELHNDKDK